MDAPDFPDPKVTAQDTKYLALVPNFEVEIDYRPVHTYTMSNDIQYIEPKARVY